MKKIIAFFGVILLPSLAFAEPILVQSSTNGWSINRAGTIDGSAISGGVSSFVTGDVSVDNYLGSEDLTRVVIRILQPTPADSPTISASISLASGSTTFTSSSSGNRVQESTTLAAGDMSFYDALDTLAAAPSTYLVTKNSANYANVTLTSPDTLERSISLIQAPQTVFDSDNFTLSSADLNSIFRDGSALNFGYKLDSIFNFARNNTEQITATTSGINSGDISIEYYGVPEPTTAVLLFGAGGLFMLLRRTRAIRA